MPPRKTVKPESHFFSREVPGLLLVGLGVFIYLSLLSYHPFDPSFFGIGNSSVAMNWGGTIGSYLADALFYALGIGAYFVGFISIFAAGVLFFGRKEKFLFKEIPIGIVFTMLISIWLDLTFSTFIIEQNELKAGGIVGNALSHWAVGLLGVPGTYLLVFVGILLSFIASTQISLIELTKFFGVLVKKMALWAYQQAQIYKGRLARRMDRKKDISISKKEMAALPETKVSKKKNEEKIEEEDDEYDDESVSGVFDDEAEVSAVVHSAPLPKEKEKKSLSSFFQAKAKNQETKKPVLKKEHQMEFVPLNDGYTLPPLGLLDSDIPNKIVQIDEASLKMNARLLEKKLMDFSVEGKVTEIHPGPVITMYEFAPAAGVKLSKIANLVDDLSLAMGGRSVRIVAPLPNKAAVGIEIPNNEREMVTLKEIIANEKFQHSDSKLTFALGKDIEGLPFVADLAKMPHLLVAGATGAGKSVSINTMILSLLYQATPEEVKLIMVDPKMLELSIYEDIPHLLLPVVTEPKKASLALKWAVREMERRYRLLSDINARNIINYNKKIEKGNFVSRQQEKMKQLGLPTIPDEDTIRHEGAIPYIVIIIDELADLMMVAGREVEESITRLAQMARAAGIHLILATQRPSVDVVTGIIKANFPARIAFKVSARHDSRTVLDSIGAERLLGNGDMLFIPPGISKMLRVHGAFISETEVGRVVDFIKKQGKPVYNESILEVEESEMEGYDGGVEEEADELYDQAVRLVAETKQASISMVQRRLRVGYNRAARMIERMEREGVVSPPSGSGSRQVLVSNFDEAER